MTPLTEQQIASLARLREPFPDSEIRHLPKIWCKACRDSRAGCNYHQVQKCQKCGNKITTAHVDLRYVGHAEATNRLLNVDPAWQWEAAALDDRGLPQYDQNGGLWIRLTVCGVTRLGYGNAEGKRGGDAVKEIIGDAIRNAGMRFGMALDLWTSSDLEIAEDGPAQPEQERKKSSRALKSATGPAQEQPPVDPDWQTALDEMRSVAADLSFTAGLASQFQTTFGHPIEQGTAAEFREATALMRGTAAA